MRGGESGDRQPDRAGHREGWGVARSLHTQALQVHRQQLPLLPPPPPQLPGPRPSVVSSPVKDDSISPTVEKDTWDLLAVHGGSSGGPDSLSQALSVPDPSTLR